MSRSFSKVTVAALALGAVVSSATAAQADSHTLSESTRSSQIQSAPHTTRAASVRAHRNAVVAVTPIKKTKRTVYRISISKHIGRAYLKWTMVGGSWRYEDSTVDGRATFTAPRKLTTLTVRAAGYKSAKFRLKKGSGVFKLRSNGVVFAWETEGSPSSYAFLAPAASPFRWDPCTYTYSVPSGYTTITSAHATRQTLTWSLVSGRFALPLLDEAFTKITKDSGWKFQQVSSGADFTVDIEYVKDSSNVSGYAQVQWINAGAFANGSMHASLGSATPHRQRVRMLMFDVGTLIGLDSVDDESQLMNSTILWEAPAKTGAGDRAGLAQLSPRNGCVFHVGDHYWLA